VSVRFDGGISKWSGLLDLALESGHVVKPSNGWYQINGDEKKYRAKETDTKEFWLPIISDKTFYEFVKSKYAIATTSILADDDIDAELEKVGDHDEIPVE